MIQRQDEVIDLYECRIVPAGRLGERQSRIADIYPLLESGEFGKRMDRRWLGRQVHCRHRIASWNIYSVNGG
jgi:hypothetical protein